MNSDRPHVAAAIAVLMATSCVERQGPKPPTFPSGGLLARSVSLPRPELLSVALEGIYDTTNRFGRFAVIHASTQGSAAGTTKAALAILARDHLAFAILEPGCFTDPTSGTATVQLVLEGYWRYLEDAEPDSGSTGLIRLFVQPSSVAASLCAGAPGPGTSAELVGATGQGNALPTAPLQVTYVQPRKSRLVEGRKSFFVGSHHGGCQTSDNCGISENTLETFLLASRLGADYLEIDVHLTADGVPVCFHFADLTATLVQGPYCFGPIAGYTYAQLVANCRLKNGELIPRLEDMLAYGLTNTDLLIWLDMKTANTVLPTTQLLGMLATRLPAANAMNRVVMGLPSADVLNAYVSAQQSGQLAPGQRCLVEENAADVTAIPCVAWSPRYTRGPMASDVQNLQAQGKFVGYWTINDPTAIDAFLTSGKPNGVLTNYLGLLNQRWEANGILPPYPVSP